MVNRTPGPMDRDRKLGKAEPIVCNWIGAVVGGVVYFVITAATGNYDPLIGSKSMLFVALTLMFTLVATIAAIGCTLSMCLQPQISRRYAARVDIAALVTGFVALLGCASMGWVLEMKFWDLTLFVTLSNGILTFGILEFFWRKRIIARPQFSLCKNCDYPIGSSPVCTECGQPVHEQRS